MERTSFLCYPSGLVGTTSCLGWLMIEAAVSRFVLYRLWWWSLRRQSCVWSNIPFFKICLFINWYFVSLNESVMRKKWSCPRYHKLVFSEESKKNQLDATWYFIVLLIGSTSFKHYYAHHQELATMMLLSTLVLSFLVCCMLDVRCS